MTDTDHFEPRLDTELFEPRMIPCGCCTNGCICMIHARPSMRIWAKTCDLHREQWFRDKFLAECIEQGTGT